MRRIMTPLLIFISYNHCIDNSEICDPYILPLVSRSLLRRSSVSFVASPWLSCCRFKAMSLVKMYP